MAEHFCEYAHNLDEACGKPAAIKWHGMWLCAEHYDWTVEFFAAMGIDAEDATDRDSADKALDAFDDDL